MTNDVRIGPVDSSIPALDTDLRDYLTAQGYVSGPDGIEWQKDFADAIAADVGVQNVTKEIDRLANKHAPSPLPPRLPNIWQV